MSSTYPTHILTTLDLPEPQQLTAKFNYNFFTTDERVDDSGDNAKIQTVKLEEVVSLSAKYPRIVKINWKPVSLSSCKTGTVREISRLRNEDILTLKNLQKMQTEQAFSNFDYTSLNFQDTGIDGKLFDLLNASYELRGIRQGSPLQRSIALNDYTRSSVDGKILTDIVSSRQACGILSADVNERTVIEDSLYDDLRNVVIHTQINNKIVGTLARAIAEDSYNIYADEVSSILKSAEQLQDEAVSTLQSNSVKSSEWDSGFIAIKEEPLGPNVASFEASDVQVLGYLLIKEEIDASGRIRKFPPLFIKGREGTTVVDPQVRYGAIYRYKVKTVASLTIPALNSNNRRVRATGLVSSQPSNAVTVNCIEFVPPPHPADFKITWDYGENALRLLWSFPVNTQQDIKYFQIFRRRTIQEPFELIRQFDFDDSENPVQSGERVQKNLSVKMSSPLTYFYDREFTKDSRFIYTLCAIDAHGLTSNYAPQFEVEFDKFSNKIKTKLISRSGAPKAFPNMYLEAEVFKDTIKTSGFKRLNIHFDPEYLRVNDSKGNDLSVLPLDDPSLEYTLQLINIDLQSSKNVILTVEDRRIKRNILRSKGGRKKKRKETKLTRMLGGLRVG